MDDATVEIENVHRQMALGKPNVQAILDGAQEIALPAFVSTLCICIVFVPMFFLTGVARYLFVPLAEAVVFAMLASYVLSRTLIPTLVMWFYRNIEYRGHARRPGYGYAMAAPVCGCCKSVLRKASPDSGKATASFWGRCWRIASLFVILFLALLRRNLASDPAARPELLPVGRCRPVQAARSCPRRDAHRRDHPARRPGRDRDSRGNSSRGARWYAR